MDTQKAIQDAITITEILDTMDLPQRRKVLTVANIRWLQRNAGVRNSDHPKLDLLLNLLKNLT